MNLSGFLKVVDELCAPRNKEELECFIHEIARKLPAEKREKFLDELRKNGNEELPLENGADKSFQERCDSFAAALMKIENADLELDSEFNESYDDWYQDEEEFVFTDPKGIGRIIEMSCDFLYECADSEEYAFGSEIAEILLSLEISVAGEYNEYDYEPLSLEDMSEKRLADIDMKRILVCSLYLEYHASDLNDRPKVLYSILSDHASCGVTLEQLMQYGEELPEFNEFLHVCISWLGDRTDRLSQRLLYEAIDLADDGSLLLESARRYVDTHPGLYEKYIKAHMGDAVSKEKEKVLYDIGQEALHTIDEKYVVRSRIALLTMKMAEDLDRVEEADDCMLEAFRSDSTTANYMRIRLTGRDYPKYAGEVSGICKKFYMREQRCYSSSLKGELTENEIDSNVAYMLAFLEGDFDIVLEKGMNKAEPLGWSGSFMKCGLAAFLLLLLESYELMTGGRKMCKIVIDHIGSLQFRNPEESERAGDIENTEDIEDTEEAEDTEEEFWRVFSEWKRTIKLSAAQRAAFLNRMEDLIDRRVEGIMAANRRNYYGECAAYVAALGEVKESAGEQDGKQRVMEQYRSKYSRRSAFHQELRVNGMIKTK